MWVGVCRACAALGAGFNTSLPCLEGISSASYLILYEWHWSNWWAGDFASYKLMTALFPGPWLGISFMGQLMSAEQNDRCRWWGRRVDLQAVITERPLMTVTVTAWRFVPLPSPAERSRTMAVSPREQGLRSCQWPLPGGRGGAAPSSVTALLRYCCCCQVNIYCEAKNEQKTVFCLFSNASEC